MTRQSLIFDYSESRRGCFRNLISLESGINAHRLFKMATSRNRVIRIGLLIISTINLVLLLRYKSGLKGGLDPVIWWTESVSSSTIHNEHKSLVTAMDEVVRHLLPPDKVAEYIARHRNFRFYVYETLPQKYTWQYLANCIERRYNVPDWDKFMTKPIARPVQREVSNCDWGSSICTQTVSSSSEYSSRRYNRNGDVVLSKIFTQYRGPLRTYDPTEADAFIVPYPATAHCACLNDRARCKLVSNDDIKTNVLGNLPYLTENNLGRHVFLSSVQRMLNHPFMKNLPTVVTLEPKPGKCPINQNCGHIIQPYVNTNIDFQPNSPVFEATHRNNSLGQRKYAISAFMSRSIGNPSPREDFLDIMHELHVQNKTIAGRPFYVSGLERRVLGQENDFFAVYRDSIFCPCFRGNTPAQKRFFDVLLSGCIPVVLSYNTSHEKGYPSFFEHRGTSIRVSYPFHRGLFQGMPEMGIDYRDLVVTIDASCGVTCIVPTVEKLLRHQPKRVRQIQRNIGRVASLFTYGMEENALKYADAVAAILVQIRHVVAL